MSPHYILRKDIDPAVYKAIKRKTSNKAYNNHSITSGERNAMSKVAEHYVMEILNAIWSTREGEVLFVDEYTHDIIIRIPNIEDTTIDVKAKQRNHLCRADFDASVASYTKDMQTMDYYFFCNVKVNNPKDQIPEVFEFVGYMTKGEYYEKATALKKGDYDGTNVKADKTRYKVLKDCWNLNYTKLHQFGPKVRRELEDFGYITVEL